MASYNGEAFLEQQLSSILCQLTHDDDEIVICDDCSIDASIDVIKSFNTNKIRLFINTSNLGHIATFETAISLCRNPLIFLSDQDDIWLPHKVASYSLAFTSNNNALLFFSDHPAFNCDGVTIFPSVIDHNFPFKVFIPLLNVRVHGPGIAFTSESRNLILPFPKHISSHDQWISLLLSLAAPVIKIPFFCQKYRLHSSQLVSLGSKSRRPILVILFSRLYMLYSLLIRFLSFKFKFSRSQYYA